MLTWLVGRGTVLYSDLTRALITNSASRRRSPEARRELRAALHQLEAEDLVVLTVVNATGRGRVGMAVSLAHPPQDGSTQGGIPR